MIADKVQSDVMIFTLTHIMVLLHIFLYLPKKIFLGQVLGLFIIISYISSIYNIFTVFFCNFYNEKKGDGL